MQNLMTWAGRSKFSYNGSVKEGTEIIYGKGFTAKVSSEQYAKLLGFFSGKVVDIGTSRDTAPRGSLGAWLKANVTKTAIASYVGPILIQEGFGKKVGKSQIKIESV